MIKTFFLTLIIVLLIFFLLYIYKEINIRNDRAQYSTLTGRVIYREDPTYEKSRLVSNYYTSKNKYPEVIVYTQNAKDVQNAILWAVKNKKNIRIRSGGHHHEGYSTGNDTIIIDVSEMKDLILDKERNIATIQPGLNNFELYRELFKEGLTHVGGTCSDVGISGLVLSGGMGPLLRRIGLTCDTLISFEMVNSKGDLINVTKDNEHKDLFWATCGGGGGNFGVITSLQIKVFPAKEVTWFNIGWDWNDPIDQIIEEWQKFFSEENKNWFSHLDLWAKSFPKEMLKKEPVKVLGFYYGQPKDAERQLSSFLKIGNPKSTIKLVTWKEAIKEIEDSTAVFLTDKPEYKSSGAFVMDEIPTHGLQTIYSSLKESESPLLNVLLFSMGGATSDISPTETAYFYRKAKFFINYSIQWLEESEDEKSKKELAILRKKMSSYTIGDYIGNPDPDLKNYLSEYYGENALRLQKIKQKYDPENIFNFEQSIPL